MFLQSFAYKKGISLTILKNRFATSPSCVIAENAYLLALLLMLNITPFFS